MKYSEMNWEQKKEILPLISAWLQPYTHDVILRVAKRIDEITNNEFAMMLIKELAEREEQEKERFTSHLEFLFDDYETFAEHDPHNNPLTHANSYRNVLYDMYIKKQ